LSSGVGGDAERATEGIIETAKLLREKYKFAGYIHLKILPGISYSTLKELARYADRLSINAEAPSSSRLSDLSSTKNYGNDIVTRMEWAGYLSKRKEEYRKKRWAEKYGNREEKFANGTVIGGSGNSGGEMKWQETKSGIGMKIAAGEEVLKTKRNYWSEYVSGLDAGQTTQFVVGANGETDLEYLECGVNMYENLGLRRVYYSAFAPVKKTKLEEHIKVPIIREHRLYQADWLLRVYGFSFDEVKETFGEDGNLSLTEDPKTTYAKNNSELFPLDINEASEDELLRVPGIGPMSAKRIVDARNLTKLTKYEELRNMGVVLKRAAPFLDVAGKKQSTLLNF